MSNYEYVETRIWSDPVFEALGPAAKLIYLWSFTNPRCNLPGIYKATVNQIVVETGIRRKRVEEAMKALEEARLLYYDGTWLFVRARVKYLHNPSPNTAKGIAKELRKLEADHPYTQAFLFMYRQAAWLCGYVDDFKTPASDPLRATNGVPQ